MASPQITQLAAHSMLMGLANGNIHSYGAIVAGIAVALEAPDFWRAMMVAAYTDEPDELAKMVHRAEQVTATVRDAVHAH